MPCHASHGSMPATPPNIPPSLPPPTQPPSLADLGASAMCSVASLSVGVPQEVIKQRLVTGIYPSFRVGVATLWRTEGIRGFYTGFVPTAARNMPFVCMTFTAFRCVCGCLLSAPCTRTRPRLGPSLSHALSLLFSFIPLLSRSQIRFHSPSTLQSRAQERSGGLPLSNSENLLYGVSSALVACVFTHPIDVVKVSFTTTARVDWSATSNPLLPSSSPSPSSPTPPPPSPNLRGLSLPMPSPSLVPPTSLRI